MGNAKGWSIDQGGPRLVQLVNRPAPALARSPRTTTRASAAGREQQLSWCESETGESCSVEFAVQGPRDSHAVAYICSGWELHLLLGISTCGANTCSTPPNIATVEHDTPLLVFSRSCLSSIGITFISAKQLKTQDLSSVCITRRVSQSRILFTFY